jgi:hypothetical protein
MSLENIIAANQAAAAQVSGTGPTTLAPAAPAAVSAAAAAPPAVAPAAAPAPPVAAPTPEYIAAFTSMQTRLAELEAERSNREQAARDAEIKLLQSKGQFEQVIAIQREQAAAALDAERKKLAATEERAKNYALEGAIAQALAGQPLAAGAASHLPGLLRSHFTVDAVGDTFLVRSKDLRSPGEYIGALLGTADYACFVKAQNPVGGTAGGPPGTQGLPTTPAQPAAPVMPKNMGEAVLMQIQAMEKNTVDPLRAGSTILNDDGSVTRMPSPGFGLRPFHPSKTG